MKYSIAEVAKKLNIPAHTIRYYESEGIIPAIQRDEGGKRVFTTIDLVALNTVNCLKLTGMSLKDIKQYIEWYLEGDSTMQKRYDLFVERKAFVEEQMAFFEKLLNIIDLKCEFYEKNLKHGKIELTDKDKEKITNQIINNVF